MAQPTNTFDTFDSIGNREDLSDEIYMLATDETPFMSNIGQTTATSTLHEWQTDALAASSGTNAHVQGDDFTGVAVTPTTRLTNRTQIAKKQIVITGTQEVVDKAGRDSEMAYQTEKQLRELKTDMEKSLCANNAAVTGDGSTASELGGYEAWVTSNVSRAGDGANGGLGTTAATDGTGRALTEALLQGVLQSCYTNGGDPNLLIAGPSNRVAISGFDGTGFDRRIDTADGKYNTSIQFYVSDFGTLEVVPSRHSRPESLLVVDTDYWATSFLRPVFSEEVPKTGDAIKEQIITEFTLEARNEAASGIVADLT